MILRKKRILIIAVIVYLITMTCLIIPKVWSPEETNSERYIQALADYNNNDFQNAYYVFSKVSKSSILKPAAIYRQALCADKLEDDKTELRKYNEVIRSYPHSKLGLRSKYLKAQLLYESKNINKAKKEFNNITKKYPKSDYAIASNYYLGAIEAENINKIKNLKKKKKAINKASQYFRTYLEEAPSGKFSIASIEKWTAINKKLTNEDNLIIATAYQSNQDYKNAQKYLRLTNIGSSWTYFVKNAYELKDYPKVKYYTELGLKGKGAENIAINEKTDETDELKNMYEAIDTYLKISNDPKTSLTYLLSFSQKSKAYDYLLYKNCENMPASSKLACYNTLYYKYPNGQFAAETLANIFYAKIKAKDYFTARKIGQKHLSKFPQSKSAPKVMFWLAKIAERTKNYEESRSYYKGLMSKFPDDYYSYHAFLNLNKFSHPIIDTGNLEGKDVLFPYKRTPENNLIIRLTEVNDYGLINELCKDDDFVQSWLEYQQGDFWDSARLARDAMEKLTTKPDRRDLRWRLVYPVHYYKEIQENALSANNSPIIILSIMREESYFNPKIKSPVGASGLMQLMPATAKEIGDANGIDIKNLMSPAVNIRVGNLYYARLRNALANRDALAVLAYNGGIGSVSRWKENLNYTDIDEFVEQIPYEETQNYLKKVYRSYWNYIRVYSDN